MFFEFSFKKIALMSGFLVILVGSVLGFLVYNGAYNFVNGTGELLARITGSTFYSAFYHLPWQDQTAAVWYATDGLSHASGVPVLLYHGTPAEGNDNPPLPQSVFIEQMRALHDDGWHTITMQQFQSFIEGKITLPPKSFLLTFDDGRKESFYPVDPVLKDLGFNAVMFVITGFSLPAEKKTSSYYLSESELAFMVASGRWELESHGNEDHRLYDIPTASSTKDNLKMLPQNHFLSNKFWREKENRIETDNEYMKRISDDLVISKETLQNKFGIRVTAFAFPFNDYGQESLNFGSDALSDISNAVKKNYSYAFYQTDPDRNDPFNYPSANAFMIKRIEPVASWSGADLTAMLQGSGPRVLPYQSGVFGYDWSSNWGTVTRNKNTLLLRANKDTTGAAALLNGSRTWQDYDITVAANWSAGSHLSLIARYRSDSETFLSCAFSTSTISLVAHSDGKQETIEATPYPYPTTTIAFQGTMSVDGNHASCSAYGKKVESALKLTYVHTGSTGIQIWNQVPNVASLDVKSVTAHGL